MKKLIIQLLIVLPIISLAQGEVTWDFPFKLEDGGLKRFKSYQERVDACQIPNDIIMYIPTSKLAKICVDYPLFEIMTAHNNLQVGYNQVSTEFNGFNELLNRNDSGDALIRLYKSLKISVLDNMKNAIDRGRYRARIFHLEFLLSDERVIEKLNNNQIHELLSETLVKLKEKKKRNIPVFRVQTTPLLMARIMEYSDFANFKIKKEQFPKYGYFTKAVFLSDTVMIEDIYNMTIEYLNEKK